MGVGDTSDRSCLMISRRIWKKISPLPVVTWWQLLAIYYSENYFTVYPTMFKDLIWNQPIDYSQYPEEINRHWYFENLKRVIKLLVRYGKVKPFEWIPASQTARPILSYEDFKSVYRNSFFLMVNGYKPRLKERTIPHDMDVASVLLALNMVFGAEIWPRKEWRKYYDLFRWNKGAYPDGAVAIGNEIFGIEVERTVNIPRLTRKLWAYPARANALVFLNLAKDKSVERAIERLRAVFYYATKLSWVREKDRLDFSDFRGYWRYLTMDGFSKESQYKLAEDEEPPEFDDGRTEKAELECYALSEG